MVKWRGGLHIAIGAGLFAILATHLVACAPEMALTPQDVEPRQTVPEESAPEQINRLFVPFIQVEDIDAASQESADVAQPIDETPAPGEPTPLPTLQPEPPVYNIGDETRGKIISLAGKEIQLPEDAYVEGVIAGLTPDPGMPPELVPVPPIALIRRNESSIGVETKTGRIFFAFGEPKDVARQEFDFLIRILGEEKIVDYESWYQETTDAVAP